MGAKIRKIAKCGRREAEFCGRSCGSRFKVQSRFAHSRLVGVWSPSLATPNLRFLSGAQRSRRIYVRSSPFDKNMKDTFGGSQSGGKETTVFLPRMRTNGHEFVAFGNRLAGQRNVYELLQAFHDERETETYSSTTNPLSIRFPKYKGGRTKLLTGVPIVFAKITPRIEP